MEKSRFKIRKKREFPFGILLLGGFLLGSMLPNLLWRAQWRQNTVASLYLLFCFADRSVSGMEYFLEVLRVRGGFALLCVLCGVTVFGVPLAFLAVILTGLEIGTLLTMSVLQFGIAGGVVGMGLLFPQFVVYLPVLMCLMEMVYKESGGVWKNQGLFPEKTAAYFLRCLLLLGVYFVGILLETVLNPFVVENLMEYIKIF